MFVTRCSAISRQASSASKRSPGSSTVFAAARDLHRAGARPRRATAARPPARRPPRVAPGIRSRQVVGDDERHLAMGQHRRLGPPGRARREEEPARIVVRHGAQRAPSRPDAPRRRRDADLPKPPPPRQAARWRALRGLRLHDRRVVGKLGLAEEQPWPRSAGQMDHLVRHEAEIGRDPHGAEPECREHGPEHLVAVLRVHEDAVALADAVRAMQGCGQPMRRSSSSRPRPRALAPHSPSRSGNGGRPG